MTDPAVKVLLIMGWTRSGSTILDNLLGEIDGFFSSGELHYIWERGLLEKRLCACGQEIESCEVWRPVLQEAFNDDVPDPRAVARWQKHAVRVRHTWKLLRQKSLPSGWAPLDSYAPVAEALYKAIGKVTGARVVVDSSKRPSDAALLPLLDGVDPYYLHLVRDPRGVAYSWKRHRREYDRGDQPAEMPRHGSIYSTFGWSEVNVAAEAVRHHVGPSRSLLVRYEDFISSPRRTLLEIARMVGEEPADLPVSEERTALLNRNHSAAGNPSRFKTGPITLRPDEEWKARLKTRDHLIATGMGLPLIRRYGYAVSRNTPSEEPTPVSS
jgi:hypothetical protein